MTALLSLLALLLFTWAGLLLRRWWRMPGEPELPRLVMGVEALRLVLVGLGVVAFVLGHAFDARVWVTLGLVFGLEELYETTMLLGLLRVVERNEAKVSTG